MNKQELVDFKYETEERRRFAFIRLISFTLFTVLINWILDSEYLLNLTLLICCIFSFLFGFYQFIFWALRNSKQDY